MTKEVFDIPLIQDPLSSTEAFSEFVRQLNDKLEVLSQRLPTLTNRALQELADLHTALALATSKKPAKIPLAIENPVDVNALKVDLNNNVIPKIQEALDANLSAIQVISEALAKVISVIAE